MENVEKMQDVSPEEKVETPEEVQQEAESSVNDQPEPPQSTETPQDEKPELDESAPAQEAEVTEPAKEEVEIQSTEKKPVNEEIALAESSTSAVVEAAAEGDQQSSTEQSPGEKVALPEEAAPEADEVASVEEPIENQTVAEEIEQGSVATDKVVEEADESSTEEQVVKNQVIEEQSIEEGTEKVKVISEELTPAQSKEQVAPQEQSSDKIQKEQVAEVKPEEQEEEENLDFSQATKEELLSKIREVGKEEKISRIDRVIKALKPRFDLLFYAEKEEAFKKFESEGNDPDSFEYHGDEIDKEFHAIYKDLRSKRNKYYKDLEGQKEDNLKTKEQLLEQLRDIVDGEESSTSMNSVKEIQAEWKKTGPVPGSQNKTLWANYNALLDRFYDQRSIYFELKDLDRKKNLKIKEEICERAEALANQADLKTAIVALNELHEEYKHAGSVPRADQEPLWQRFKAASDAVYSKRKDYFDHLKVEFEANYEKKLVLAQEAETFISYDSDKISDWNTKTKEIQQLQKRWEEIGGLPRDKAKAINKQFWGSFKKFFSAKNQFFKRLESGRDDNLKKKEDLIAQAEELKESTDWGSTTQKFKNLQAQWKEIGPVPEKVRNEIYKRFKAAGDHFFNQRRDQNSEQEQGYEENLKLKLQICDKIEAIAEQDEINLDDIYDLVDNHAQLGFVPRNAINKERERFDKATGKILSLEDLEEHDRNELKNHIQRSFRRNFSGNKGSESKGNRKEHSIRRKIAELENDISTWNTNMEFFAASATADKLKADLQTRINEAKGTLEDLKSQLSSIS